LPPEIRIQLPTLKRTNQEWKDFFSRFEPAVEVDSADSPPIGVGKLVFKTPKKFLAPTDAEIPAVFIPSELQGIEAQSDMLSDENCWWTEDDDTSLMSSSLLQFLKDIRGFMLSYRQWLVEPHEIASNRLGSIEDDMHQLKKYCEAMSDNLGRPINILDMDFPDVWCALEYLGSLVSSLSNPGDVKDMQVQLNQISSLVSHIQPLVNNVQDLNARFATIDIDVKRLKEVTGQHEARFELIKPLLLRLPQHFSELAALVHRVDGMSTSLNRPASDAKTASDPWFQVSQFGQMTTGPSAAPMPDSASLDAATAPDVVVRLNTLEHALKSLEKRTIGEGTKIGRFLFQSQEDLRLWMVTHVPNNRFGLFLDAVSIFDFLAQPHLDTQENMSQLYNSQKNGFETTYESRIVSSMQNLFPNLFGKASADGMDTSKALPGLQTVEKWNHNGVTGLYLQVERELPNDDLQFRNAIATTFENYPEARDLSLELLYRSKKFVLDLCNFIQRDYDFWSHKGYKSTEAWQLTCLSVRRIFEDIHIVRVIGRDCRDIKNPQLTATQVVWATIRSHTVMDEYSRRNFFEHPSISAVIARHLASHHTRPDFAIEDRVRRLENTVSRWQSTIDSIVSRLANLEGLEDVEEEAKNDYSPLKKPRGGKKKGIGQQGKLPEPVA